MRLELSVSSSHDCVDSPSLALVTITPPLAQRIRHLSSAVTALHANSVDIWDGSPDWLTEEDPLDEHPGAPTRNLARMECVLLNVTREDFYWTGIIKHTDVRCSTNSVPISRLDGLRHAQQDTSMPSPPHIALAIEVGRLVTAKQLQYGDSFGTAPKILRLLYPNGIQPDQYDDLLTIVRILDKFKRLATNHVSDTENPWQDIAGYSLLALHNQHTKINDPPPPGDPHI